MNFIKHIINSVNRDFWEENFEWTQTIFSCNNDRVLSANVLWTK